MKTGGHAGRHLLDRFKPPNGSIVGNQVRARDTREVLEGHRPDSVRQVRKCFEVRPPSGRTRADVRDRDAIVLEHDSRAELPLRAMQLCGRGALGRDEVEGPQPSHSLRTGGPGHPQP